MVLDRVEDEEGKRERGKLPVGCAQQLAHLVDRAERDARVDELVLARLLDVVPDALRAAHDKANDGSEHELGPPNDGIDRDDAPQALLVRGRDVQRERAAHRLANDDHAVTSRGEIVERGERLAFPLAPRGGLEVLPGGAVAGEARADRRNVLRRKPFTERPHRRGGAGEPMQQERAAGPGVEPEGLGARQDPWGRHRGVRGRDVGLRKSCSTRNNANTPAAPSRSTSSVRNVHSSTPNANMTSGFPSPFSPDSL